MGGDTDSILIAPIITTVTLVMPLNAPMAVTAVVIADAPMVEGLVVVIVNESIFGTH